MRRNVQTILPIGKRTKFTIKIKWPLSRVWYMHGKISAIVYLDCCQLYSRFLLSNIYISLLCWRDGVEHAINHTYCLQLNNNVTSNKTNVKSKLHIWQETCVRVCGCVFHIIRFIFHFYCCQWIERTKRRLYFTLSQTDFTFVLSIESQPISMHILCAGPPPVHQLIRNDKTEKPPTVSVSSAPTFSSVLRPEDGHRGIESPHSQTGMYSLDFSNCLLRWSCELLENLAPIWSFAWEGWTRRHIIYILILRENRVIFITNAAIKLTSNRLSFFTRIHFLYNR